MASLGRIEVDITQITEVVDCLGNIISACFELNDKHGNENSLAAIKAALANLKAIHDRLAQEETKQLAQEQKS